MTQIETTIRHVLSACAKLSVDAASVNRHADLFDLGLTSLATVEVMLALEEQLGVEFPDAALRRQTFSSIAALCDGLEGMGATA